MKLHLLFFTAATLLMPQASRASLCEWAYGGVVLGALSDDPKHAFVPLKGKDLTGSTFIPDTPARDQHSAPCCYIATPLAGLEHSAKKTFGHDIQLSMSYQMTLDLYRRALQAIYTGDKMVFNGGFVDAADWTARNIGVVPKGEHWQPKANLFESAELEKIVTDLNQIIDRGLIALQNEYLIPIANIVTALKGQPVEVVQKTWDDYWFLIAHAGQFRAKVLALRLEVKKYLENRIGKLPSSFEVDGKKFSPNSFVDAISPATPEDYYIRTYLISDRKAHTKNKAEEPKASADTVPRAVVKNFLKDLAKSKGTEAIFKNMLWVFKVKKYPSDNTFEARLTGDEAKQKVRTSIAQGKPVYINIVYVPEFVDAKKGLFSISAKGKTVEQADHAESEGNHFVLITGEYRTLEGELLGYRVQNSWGDDVGIKGYFFLDVDYFDAFSNYITLPNAPTL